MHHLLSTQSRNRARSNVLLRVSPRPWIGLLSRVSSGMKPRWRSVTSIRRSSMASQLDLLKEALKESEARSGSDNPFVQGLKMQIARLEKPPAENPTAEPDRLSVEMRSKPP